MTHFLQRSALILMATGALCATPALARPHARAHAAKAASSAAHGKIVTLQDERADYVVKKGDTLDKIADKLDTTVADLMTANKLKKTSVLQPGDTLKGPAVTRKAYVVAHGDTVFSISKRFHVTVDQLREENGLSAKAQIHSGQQIRLPADFKAPAGADEKPDKVVDAAADRPEPAAKGAKGRKGKSAPVADETPAAGDHGAGGRVTTTQSRGETYKAKKGDTLAKVAAKLDTSVSQLKRLNHLKGGAIHAGQVLRGPSFAEHVYTAVSGDTLAGIAQRFSISVASLRAENEWSKRVVSVRPGQKVYLPDGYRDRNAEAEERPLRSYLRPGETSRGEPTLPSQPQPYSPSGQPRSYAPPPGSQNPSAVTPTPAPTDAQVAQLSKGRFQWPIQGDVISEFGPKAGGQRNDGINIQAEAGAPVRAAADGDVVYAGDQVPGFGNLVLIKHADGWATAYSHLSRIDVKAQQKITQGQQIGQAGATGGVTEPQLHFEVRYGAHAVDPKLVLPK